MSIARALRPRAAAAAWFTLLALVVLLSGFAARSDATRPRLTVLANAHSLRHHRTRPEVAATPPSPIPTPSWIPNARVTLDLAAKPSAIPPSFLGFSTEYSTLPIDAHHAALYARLLSLVHAPGDAPFVLRIGGNSSDNATWAPSWDSVPTWAFRITPAWINQTAAVVRANRLHVVLDLNFIRGSMIRTAAWASEAEQTFPARSIIGLEMGNEPDLWGRGPEAPKTNGSTPATLPPVATPRGYAAIFDQYAQALHTVAPGEPLLGPALAAPFRNRGWITTLLHHPHPGLASISIHEYPYSACARHTAVNYPSVAKLMSARAATVVYDQIHPAVRLASRAGLPVRLTEFNSITCGGVSGVSDTFATALWAPDALFEMIRAGIAGADLHVRTYSANTPFWFTRNGVQVRPLLYGLILFDRMLGAGAGTVPAVISAPAPARLRVWAVHHRDGGLSVLLLNKGTHTANVALHLPGGATASVQRLLAPSASATTGVTLDGQSLDQSLRWQGSPVIDQLTALAGVYDVTVPPASAALVTVPLS